MATRHDDMKKAAVLTGLLAGQSISEVAREHPDVPVGTIKSWAYRMRVEKEPLLVTENRSARIGDLVFDNLEAMLEAQNAILAHVSTDTEWLRKQDASELAVLFGVIGDKAFRILQALPDGTERSEDDLSGVHSEGLA